MDTTETTLKSFFIKSYDELEELNLAVKDKAETLTPAALEKEYAALLREEKGIKAVTVAFSDIEGRMHELDYDKDFLLDSLSNLTFDGSSIRGFTPQHESDLRLELDWGSMRFLPADVFGPGKVIFFASVLNRDRSAYQSDFRGQLKQYTKSLKKREGIEAYSAGEIEGFLVDGISSEQEFITEEGFVPVSAGGYYHSLPMDTLRVFIDDVADVLRATGFTNEKNHPEVAPSQFEINFSYAEVVRAADNVQLYKFICRQVARNMGLTATFLPKPFMGINGSGMHTNFSLAKDGKNIFYDAKGQDGLSRTAWDFVWKLLNHAPDLCLIINSSVNSYRRLDPHYEAPNQIKVSAIDRGSMIRIPVGNEKTARIEVRSVAPDSNPYLVLYTILRTGLEGEKMEKAATKDVRYLPSTIQEAIRLCKGSAFMKKILGEESKEKYISFKQAVADRSPAALGTQIKDSEVIYHHEITNQSLWSDF